MQSIAQSSAPSAQKSTLMTAWIVWGLAAIFYFSDYLARVAPGVMHHQLQLAFGISEAGFGLLTASFYIPYIAMQLPVGLAVDRVSIRALLAFMSLLTALGCCVFAVADGLMVASIGRMLIGFSAAFAFVCTLRLATAWFPPAMLGLLAGLTQALGMLGAAAGEAPVAFFVDYGGWRYTLYLIATLFIILAALLYRFISDGPRAVSAHENKTRIRIFESLKIALSSKQIWINALYTGFVFAPTAVIGESLGPAYLQFGRGLNAHSAAVAIGLIFLGWGIGGPLTGWLSDKIGRRKPLMIGSAFIGVLLASLIVFLPSLDRNTAYMLFFIYGLTNTGVSIAYAVSTELSPRRVIGTTIGFTNMTSILVGAFLQPVVGYFIDKSAGARSYHVESLLISDFQAGFWILPICSFIALLLSLFVKETFCKEQLS